jgi:uncharacterized membrane protein YcaP (DUF421 family)
MRSLLVTSNDPRELIFMDWESIFLPDVPLLEIIVRGSVMYITLFILLRVVLKRQTGGLAVTDLLLVVLIADASQNAMSGGYNSIAGGIVLVTTIVFWSYAFDWLGYKYSWFRRLSEPPPLLLVHEGNMLRRNMRHELITEDELMTQIRKHGLDDIKQVKEAYMESDGQISIVHYEEKGEKKEERKEMR